MTGRHPRVTVVVPVRDGAGLVEDCLTAVLAQDWPPDQLEVVVVDGGSADGTAALARRALAGGRGRVIVHEGGTVPANCNAGLAVA
ncbi:MAG: glycosyltransferase, partial [Acidimicrobiales bacterium]